MKCAFRFADRSLFLAALLALIRWHYIARRCAINFLQKTWRVYSWVKILNSIAKQLTLLLTSTLREHPPLNMPLSCHAELKSEQFNFSRSCSVRSSFGDVLYIVSRNYSLTPKSTMLGLLLVRRLLYRYLQLKRPRSIFTYSSRIEPNGSVTGDHMYRGRPKRGIGSAQHILASFDIHY